MDRKLLYVTRSTPFGDLDLTPLGLSVTGVCFTASFHRYGKLLSVPKLAHLEVFNQMSDSVLILDRTGHLVAGNSAAHRTLNLPALPVPLASLSDKLADLFSELPSGDDEVESDVDLPANDEVLTLAARGRIRNVSTCQRSVRSRPRFDR